MALTLRPARLVLGAAICITAAACGSARVGTPVPAPFPSPEGTAVDASPEGTAGGANPEAVERGAFPGAFPREAPVDASGAPPDPLAAWMGADFPRYLEILEAAESGGDCLARPAAGSAVGCYQMTAAALQDAGLKDASGDWLDNDWGVDSDDEFERDRRAQDAAMLVYTAGNWRALEPCVRDLMGRRVGGIALDQGALIAGAHLLGATGLIRYVRCGLGAGCFSRDAASANGGGSRLHRIAIQRMHAAHGLRVLTAQATSGSRCRLPGGRGDRSRRSSVQG